MKIFIITLLSFLGSVIAECDYEKVMFLLCHSNFYNDENSNNQTQVAQSFFDNCEKGYGWDGTKEFVTEHGSPWRLWEIFINLQLKFALLRCQMVEIPMGDPLSPGICILTCGWMESEWMESIPLNERQLFRGTRYIDDVLLFISKKMKTIKSSEKKVT